MKLLLDQGLPRGTASLLNQTGFDVVHVGDIGLAAADDLAIIQLAREQGRVVVTLDADFHTILAVSGKSSPSVVRVRIEGLRSEKLAELLLAAIGQCRRELDAGAAVSLEEGRIRLHMLPLRRSRPES